MLNGCTVTYRVGFKTRKCLLYLVDGPNKAIDTVRKLSPVDASFIEAINEFQMKECHKSIGDLTLQTGYKLESIKAKIIFFPLILAFLIC